MSKKQLIVLTFFVAAVPAAVLLVKMLFSLFLLLADQSSATPALWVVYVICLLGSVFIALLPLFLWLYYPAEGFAIAGNTASDMMTAPAAGGPDFNAASDDEDEFEDDESADAEDDGERLFDDDDMEADDDDFDGGFDDEE